MKTEFSLIKDLALHAAKGTAPSEFSVSQVNQALADQFKEIAGNINNFARNRYDIYDILIEVADEFVPQRVMSQFGIFANVRQVENGQTVSFKRRLGRNRAKSFITAVGLSGVYETFRLDTSSFTVQANAIGGAGIVDFERMLDGSETIQDIMDIMNEGLVEAIMKEIMKALQAASTVMGTNNVSTGSAYSATTLNSLVNVVRAYSPTVAIFATPAFIANMGPDAIVAPIVGSSTNYGGVPGVYSPDDINAIHQNGFIKMFRGVPVIPLMQSYTDETNATRVIDDSYAYILPAGGEKVVNVIMEGQTQVYDFVNRDQSYEIHFYKKVGVALNSYNNWALYQVTDSL